METLEDFITIVVPLVIIMDPIGNLPFFLLFTKENTSGERARMAFIASLVACIILIFFGVTGDAVLDFFGIGLPAFQIAGGLIFFVYALQMLRLIPSGIKSTEEEERESVTKENVALVPLATPLLAGPGAITAVLVRQQNAEDALSIPLLVLAVVLACLTIYCVFLFGEQINRFLGVGGVRVVARFTGLLLAVIAVQFVVSGIQGVAE
jgi:multiple antibiotic resistance protein